MNPMFKLQPMLVQEDNGKAQPMKRKDRFEDILAAFEGDVADEGTSDNVDALYSDLVSQGVLSDDALGASFDRLLQRRVVTDPESGETSLLPADAVAVGDHVRAFREARGASVEEFARDQKLSQEAVTNLEASTERFDPDRLLETAKAVAMTIGLSAARVHTLLQSIRAMVGLRGADGPTLMAARKVPPK
jgi:hypothetical protein